MYNVIYFNTNISPGHVKFQRTTTLDREDRKKQEKREKREGDGEETDRTIWVKYTLGLKHQVIFKFYQ